MELLRKMPHQNIRLARVLSDSGQHCVDLSPIKNYNLDGAQTLSRTNFLWLWFGSRFEDFSPSKITLLEKAPTFFSNCVLCFKCSTVESWTLHNSLQPSWLLLCGWVASALPCMFPSSAHLFPHSDDLYLSFAPPTPGASSLMLFLVAINVKVHCSQFFEPLVDFYNLYNTHSTRPQTQALPGVARGDW